MNNNSSLSTLLGVLAMGLIKKNNPGSSVRLTRGFRPIVNFKFRIKVATNVNFNEYQEEDEDNYVYFDSFPDDLKNSLYEYFIQFGDKISELNPSDFGFEDFEFFIVNMPEDFLYLNNDLWFDFWFIFDKAFVATVSSEVEFQSIFEPDVIDDVTEESFDLMKDFVENKLLTFVPDLGDRFRLGDMLNVFFLDRDYEGTYRCLIDVETGKRINKVKHKESNLRKK